MTENFIKFESILNVQMFQLELQATCKLGCVSTPK